MNKYNIQEYKTNEIDKLSYIWSTLEKGNDMTYFQQYEWYKTIIKFWPSDCRNFISRFLVISKNEVPVIIAPFWIVLRTFDFINLKGCYFIGRLGWSDYLNFIYIKFEEESFKTINKYIKEKYNIDNYYLENIKESTTFYKWTTTSGIININKNERCVSLALPDNIDEYKKMLSKNARQNIRTAMNRCKKDKIQLIFNFDDNDIDLELCKSFRSKRLEKKFIDIKKSASLIKVIIAHFLKRNKYKFPYYNVIEEDKNSNFMTAKINNKIVAFFSYGYDKIHKQIVIMAAGINDEYHRYSPGIQLMYNFIIFQIKNENRHINIIDFTRGNEMYKYTLGGKDKLIHKITIDFNKSFENKLKKYCIKHLTIIAKKIM